MHVAIGTAGHIDHGKSTLVKALTGANTDRLPEEKRRGITIELGFASWDLGSGVTASVIDVPGHERLVHTMVAGAWGLDLLLLVVAADEGVMPQTREHVAIASLLGVRGMVVALSKVDRVEPELVELAAEEVRAQLQGAGLGEVPVVPVSAQTGVGLPTLRAELLKAVKALPPRPVDGVPFLPVDRVFSVKGFGTVVTGTLSGGSLKVDDEVDVHPGPKGVRARGLQSHGKTVTQAQPGWRTAVNLPGVAVTDVPRGAVLCPTGALVPTRRVDVQLRTLAEAPRLRDHASVMVHVGAAAVPARLRLVYEPAGESPGLEPGTTSVVQLILEGEMVCRPGQRFILRGHRRLPGQGATFGGGEILDPHPPRRRRGRPDTASALEALRSGGLPQRLGQAVWDTGALGADLAQLRRRLPWKDVKKAVDDAVGRAQLRRARLGETEVLWHPDRLAEFTTRLQAALTRYHQDHPLEPHAPLEEMRTTLKVDGQVLERARFSALLGVLKSNAVVVEGDGVRLASHRPKGVSPELLSKVEHAHVEAGLAPPSRGQLATSLGVSEGAVSDATKALVSSQKLVRVKDDLHFARTPYDALVARTLAFIDEKGGITTQEFKDLMGETRKYVIPFLEHLDDARITLRVGEKRVRRSPRAAG
ncbi:MAG: selenocysteine-specific translation elongation factor [Myxococcota bacterium]